VTNSKSDNNKGKISNNPNDEDGTELDAYIKWEYRF
jgi:hypothetical protein